MGGIDSQGGRNQAATNQNNKREIQREGHRMTAKIGILIADFILSVAWIWVNHIIRMVVDEIIGLGHNQIAVSVTYALRVASMFLFALLGNISKGGAHNPLTILIGAMSADFNNFLFTVCARTPVEVLGSIVGVKLLMDNFSDVGRGPQLSVALHHGALVEGILAFVVAIISMGLTQSLSRSFYRRNWISSISKITLQVLAADLTGASTNPAAAIGWAYARGDHATKEHFLVYWLAPVEATVLGVWVFKLLSRTGQDKKVEKKTKSE